MSASVDNLLERSIQDLLSGRTYTDKSFVSAESLPSMPPAESLPSMPPISLPPLPEAKCAVPLCRDVWKSIKILKKAAYDTRSNLEMLLPHVEDMLKATQFEALQSGFTEEHRREITREINLVRDELIRIKTTMGTGVNPAHVGSILPALDALSLSGSPATEEQPFLPQRDLADPNGGGEPCVAAEDHDPEKYLPRVLLKGVDCKLDREKHGEGFMFKHFGDDHALNVQAAESKFVVPELVTHRIPSVSIIGAANEKNKISENFIAAVKFPNMQYDVNTLFLYGPPGTGKSYLAEAIPTIFSEYGSETRAGEHIRMYKASASSIKSSFNGQTEVRIALLYKWLAMVRDRLQAVFMQRTPMIFLFIDELESLLGSRTGGTGGGTDTGPVVTSFLPLLDPKGDQLRNIVTIGATNLPWDLDAAVMRRFGGDSAVFVDLPDYTTIKSILYMIMSKKIHDDGVGDSTNPNEPYLSSCGHSSDSGICQMLAGVLDDIAKASAWTYNKDTEKNTSTSFSWHIEENFSKWGYKPDQIKALVAKLVTDKSPTEENAVEAFSSKRSPFGYSASDTNKLGRALIGRLAKILRGKPTEQSDGTTCVPFPSDAECTQCRGTTQTATDYRAAKQKLYKTDNLKAIELCGKLCNNTCDWTQQQRNEFVINWKKLDELDPDEVKKELFDTALNINTTVNADEYCRVLYYSIHGTEPKVTVKEDISF